MNYKSKSFIIALVIALSASLFGFGTKALANNPILSLSGSGTSFTLSISQASPDSSVQLNYTVAGSSLPTTITNFGTTDNNGNFTTSFDTSTYGITGGSQVYVTVAGQQSNSVTAGNGSSSCGYYGCGTNNNGSLSLSQTSLSLTSGQSSSVTAYTSYGGSVYISSNTNSNVASANVSGNNINVYGLSSGSTTISVCQNSYSQCASLYVTVNGNSGSGNVTFSPSAPNLYVGQSLAVSINSSSYNSANYYYNNSTYYVSSNSSPNVVSANISGTVINLYAEESGSDNIDICLTSLNFCGTLYVTVNGSGMGNNTLSLSQTSVSLSTGQTSTVSANNYNGSLYISSNTNSNVVSANVSGSIVNLYALNSGSSTVQVCENLNSQCAYIYITVNGGGNGTLSLSQTSVNLNSGQSSDITISGNGSYYVSSNSNSSAASASISGNILYLVGLSSGNTTISVCQSSYGQCGSVYVTVNGNNNNSSIYFSPTTANVNLGQTLTVSIYSTTDNYADYYISSNSNSSVATASITGTDLYLYGNSNGNDTITVCQNSYGSCGTLYIQVGNNGIYNNNSLSLSETSLNVYPGQSGTVTIYGNGNYYVSSNSNSYVASASISGDILNVYGSQNGSTTIVVCQNSYSTCDNLYVTVGSSGNYSNTFVLSQYNLSLNMNQSGTIDVSGNGGYGYYVGQNSNPGVASASFSGSVLSVYGLQNGTSTIQICQNGASSCQSLYVSVGGYVNNNGGTGGLKYPGNVLGATTFANGELISQNSTVYIVYKNTETPFSNSQAFLGLGFKFSNVLGVSNSGLSDSGYIVSSSHGRHPYGSWIKNGQTVYLVDQSGLIPVPDWNTFLNNGGQASWIVNANYYDLGLPLLSPMTDSDSRLQ